MRRKNLWKKLAAVGLAGIMVVSAMACGSKNEEPEATDSAPSENVSEEESEEAVSDGSQVEEVEIEETTINIRVMNEYLNLDKVLEKYEEMVADDPVLSKIHLNFSYVAGADYKDKLTMALTAQEDYDLMFCGSWHGLSSFIQDGSLADLSEYFNNDKFPGLKTAFPEQTVDAMTSYILQEDGTYKTGVFGINLASYYEDTRGFIYREDLRNEYGCDPITDEESIFLPSGFPVLFWET